MTIVVTETATRTPSTAGDIVTRALRGIAVLGSGETAKSDIASDGFSMLNEMIEAWANDGLTIYAVTQESFELTGAESHTIGSGGDFDTDRPARVLSAFARVNGIDYPVDLVTEGQYNGICSKGDTNAAPSVLYVDAGYPLTTLKAWPVAQCTLFLNSLKPLTAFSSLSTQVNLPPGYERALRLCLQVEMMPEYGMESPMIIRQAINAKKSIQRANYRPSVMELPAAVVGRQ